MCTEKIIFMAGNTHEYVAKEGNCDFFCRRAPHGARGLKQLNPDCTPSHLGRAPHGARGLKRYAHATRYHPQRSRPARGAWIETLLYYAHGKSTPVAPRTGRVD